MIQEDKVLLLKDLCARLPYGVKVNGVFLNYNKDKGKILYEECDKEFNYEHLNRYETLKPYLFPLSSMTEEQKKEYNILRGDAPIYHYEFGDIVYDMESYDNWGSIDYLNTNHFDYRGLIKKGLAIDATGLNIY